MGGEVEAMQGKERTVAYSLAKATLVTERRNLIFFFIYRREKEYKKEWEQLKWRQEEGDGTVGERRKW